MKTRVSSIWFFSFAYFACYVPYSALAKMLSDRRITAEPLSGLAMLPLSVGTSMVAMFAVVTALGWWKHASSVQIGSVRLPRPTRWTLLSGLSTGAIVVTTTLAYAFDGVSIPFVMLLMRGGVLVLAPLVDALAHRGVRWYSWLALALSLGALSDAAFGPHSGALPWLCAIDVGLYLLAYFVRLRFMSHLAKNESAATARRYFVEEQMVATPAALAFIVALACVPSPAFAELRRGFYLAWTHPRALHVAVMGLLSQGTGLFGGLVLLDARENTFCVPLNRASSLLAGVVAAAILWLLYGTAAPTVHEIASAAVLALSVVILAIGPKLRVHRRATLAP